MTTKIIPSGQTGVSPIDALIAFQKLRADAEDEGYPYMEPEFYNYIEDLIREDISGEVVVI